MIAWIKLIFLLAVPGMVAAAIDSRLSDERSAKRIFLKYIMYSASVDALMWIIKWFRGSGALPVTEVFLLMRTVLIFALAAFAAAVILPIFIQCRLPEKVRRMFGLWLSHGFVFFSVSAVSSAAAVYLYHRAQKAAADGAQIGITVNHALLFCIVFLCVNLILSCVVYWLPSGLKNRISAVCSRFSAFIRKDDKSPFGKRLLSACLVALAFVFSVIVFIPYEVYLGNGSDFTFEFSSFWWIIAAEGLLVFAVAVIILMLFRGKMFGIMLSLLTGITLAGYAQSMFMNGMMDKMSGVAETWSGTQVAINLVIWIAIAIAPAIVCIFTKKIWKTVCSFASVLLIGVQAVALISMMFTVDVPKIDTRLTNKGLYEVSSDKNVIVFVLDKFDQTYIDRMLSVYPDALDGLHGFTYYPNATGSYCFTHVAVPYLLSAQRIPEYDPTTAQFVEQIDTSDYFNYITEHTGNVGIYTNEFCLRSPEARSKVSNCEQLDYYLNAGEVAEAGLRSSMYRVLPFKFKQRFSYSSDNFNSAVTPISTQNLYNPDTHMTDAQIMNKLKKDGLQINESYGGSCFRFIHTKGTHEYQQLDHNANFTEGIVSIEETAAGEFAMVSEYCKRLNELGLYENATIIITADHGYAPIPMQAADCARNVNPIMFYKPAGNTYAQDMQTLDTPVSHDDIFATVINALGGDGSEFGRAFDEIGEDEDRTRLFYWAIQNPEVTDKESPIHVEYEINGDARDGSSWKSTGKAVYPNNTPKELEKHDYFETNDSKKNGQTNRREKTDSERSE